MSTFASFHGLPYPFGIDEGDRVARVPGSVDYAPKGCEGFSDSFEFAFRLSSKEGTRRLLTMGRAGVLRNRWVAQVIR